MFFLDFAGLTRRRIPCQSDMRGRGVVNKTNIACLTEHLIPLQWWSESNDLVNVFSIFEYSYFSVHHDFHHKGKYSDCTFCFKKAKKYIVNPVNGQFEQVSASNGVTSIS